MKRRILISASFLVLTVFGLLSLNSFINLPSPYKFKDDRPVEQNYQNFCAGCHGENLEKFAAKEWMDEKGTGSAFKSIKFGIETIGMPSFQKTFSDTEIEALAGYVKKGIPADKSKLKPAITAGAIVESEVQRFVVDTVVTGLSIPWGLACFPNGDLLISERAGFLYLLSKG